MSRAIVLCRALCAASVVATSVAVAAPAAQAATTAPGGAFRAVRAVRVLDTRQSQVTPKTAGSTVYATVRGVGGVPTTGVAAVVVNVTAVAPQGTGALTVFPTAATRPATSNVRFTAGRTVSNLVTVPVGSLGRISVYVSGAATHVLADVQGWYTTAAATVGTAGLLQPLTPGRLLDTRSGAGGTRIPARGTIHVQVSGRRGIPASGAGAVVLNGTVLGPTESGGLTIWPRGATKPGYSNVHFLRGRTVANRALVGVGSGGQVSLYNGSAAPLHVLLDTSGWFTDATADATGAGYFNAVPSRRTYNTGSSPLGTTPRRVRVTGINGVPGADVVAVAITTTVVNPSAAGSLRIYPVEPPPGTSDQSHVAGLTIANHAIAMTSSTGGIQLRNSAGTLQALVDTAGYYVRKPGPPVFTSASPLPAGHVAVAYDQTLTAAGGKSPYTFALASGTLPPGISVTGDGQYAGTPTAEGTYTPVLRVTDAYGSSTTKAFTHVVQPAPGPLAVTTDGTLPQAQAGAPYTTTLAATGGVAPYAWQLASGTLPGGLTLSSGGVLSGTPTAAQTSSFTVRVTDAQPAQATKQLTLTVAPAPAPPSVTTTGLAQGKKGVPYTATLTATGGTPGYTWSVSGGALPGGLALASDGTLSGTPTGAGTSSFTVKVTDASAQFATKALTLAVVAFEITSASPLPGGTAGAPYSHTLTTVHGTAPVTFAVTAGALPAGLTLSSAGALAGTPATAGVASFSVTATDDDSVSATKAFSLTVAAAPSPTITTTSLPGGRLSTPYSASLAASGGTPPYTWTSVGTALPPGLSLSAGGALSGTPAQTGTWTPTFRVADNAGQSAQATLAIAVTAGSDWTQPGYDMGHTAYAANETAVTAANAASLRRVWAHDGGAASTAVAGGVLYAAGTLPGETAEPALTAYDIVTSEVLWQVQMPCGAGDVAVTATAVLFPCDGRLRAYARGGSHALLWDTAVTDPNSGLSVNDFAVMGDRVIAVDSSAVYGYSLSSGARLWRQFLPAGAFGQQVAVSGTTAVVAMGDRLRTYDTANGTAGWTVLGSAYTVVVDNGAVYTVRDGELRRLALATGAEQWATSTGGLMDSVLGGNGTRVLALWRLTDPDSGIETRTRAYTESTGVMAWESSTPNRVLAVAITPALAWVTTADYGGAFGSDTGTVTAVSMTDGEVVHTLDTGRRIFSTTAISDGRLVVARSTSLRVYGLDRPLPAVATKVLRSGHVGRPYSDVLAATGGTAPYTWSVVGGTLPSGLTLAGGGALGGTPTAAATRSIRVRVTDAAGASLARSFVVQVSPTGPGAWPTVGGNAARTGLAATETTIGVDSVAQLDGLWSAAALATDEAGDLAVAGDKVYVSQSWTGDVYAYSRSAGASTGRTPLWVARTDVPDQEMVQSGVTVVPGHLLVGTYRGLYSFNPDTGAKQWKAPYEPANPGISAPLVLGSRVFVGDGDGELHAFDLATGAALWAADAWVPETFPGVPGDLAGLSTDGTRVFAASACTLYAVTPATGAVEWKKALTPRGNQDCAASAYKSIPLVANGIVYAGSQAGTMAFDAATGAVVWQRFAASGGSMALSNGVLLVGVDEGGWWGLRAVDAATGALLWQSITLVGPPRVVAAGDLVLTSTSEGVKGVDIRTGDLAWAGTPSSGYAQFQPAVVDGVIYHVGGDHVLRAYGLPA